ncbi:MAG: glycosyltransferase family 4 protein [bacterium]|nr:glycosyltransferase family 4 protein [bacterium]
MKILLIHNYYRFRGGEDRYVETLAETLTSNGHQVVRFAFDSKDINNFNLMDKLLISLRLTRSPRLNKKLEKILQEEKPQLAVIHNLFPLISLSILKVLKGFNIPIVKRIENYRFLCLNGLFLRNETGICDVCKKGNLIPGILHKCYQNSYLNSIGMALPLMITNWKKMLFNHVDIFLAPSRFIKEKFSEVGFPREKITVLPNFLDFDPVESVREPSDYAVFVGRLSVEKGLTTLLEAVRQLPDLPLKILGEGPLSEELKDFVRRNNMKNVEFTGFIDGAEKKEIVSRARFLIFPSECYESFGYSVIESHACGIPVIASGIGGAAELLVDGINGYLFEPGNPGDLRDKISILAGMDHDKLMAMKERCLQPVKELYTREAGYENLLELLKRLVKDSA